jgi:hypothetical protein
MANRSFGSPFGMPDAGTAAGTTFLELALPMPGGTQNST